MNLETLKVNREKILDCEVKDESGLNDYQKLAEDFGISIPKVGIERFRIPLSFKHASGEVLNHDSYVSMFVSLGSNKTGVNMSRFCTILQEEAGQSEVNSSFLKKVLRRFRFDLRDSETDPAIEEAFLKVEFNYPVKQKSLKSDNWGWQYYPCILEANENDRGEVAVKMTLKYEYSSTCPCSLSMSKQYEQEYAEGKTTIGNGIATAHGQRSLAACQVELKPEADITIEELLELIRAALPTETQSLVKRIDEQAFAILNGENPMFVEHASRRLALVFNEVSDFADWNAKVEHFESLHSHNAVAYISK